MAHPEITGSKANATAHAAAEAPLIRGPPTSPATYTIATFCVAHDLSESFYFKLRKQGLGPRETKVGGRVFISFEAAAAWRAEREAETAAVASTAAERGNGKRRPKRRRRQKKDLRK
jgi:hypothetical protein